jgi:hypothetical protein
MIVVGTRTGSPSISGHGYIIYPGLTVASRV